MLRTLYIFATMLSRACDEEIPLSSVLHEVWAKFVRQQTARSACQALTSGIHFVWFVLDNMRKTSSRCLPSTQRAVKLSP